MNHSVTDEEVEIRTADGLAGGVVFCRAGVRQPPVVHLPDGIGTRTSQREMARRIAAEGYTVLLPNIYYRTAEPPFFPPKPDFTNEAIRSRFGELTAPLSPDAMERDATAYVHFLLARDDVQAGPAGIAGFCFTGQFALRAAAALPGTIAAAASFHGGGLFKEGDGSPHLVLPRVKARLYFGHARDDRGMPAEAIRRLEQALAEWGGSFTSETYDAWHGWTVPDSAAYDEPEAERAFERLRALFAATLR